MTTSTKKFIKEEEKRLRDEKIRQIKLGAADLRRLRAEERRRKTYSTEPTPLQAQVQRFGGAITNELGHPLTQQQLEEKIRIDVLRQAMFEEEPPPIKYPLGDMPFSMGTRAPMDETDAMIAALGKDMYQEALVDFAKKEKDKYESNPSLYTAERFLEKIRELERAYPLNPKLVIKLFNQYISDLFDYKWNDNLQRYVLRDDIESATLREERILSQIRNGGG